MGLNWSMWGAFYSKFFLESLFWNNICRQYVISLYIYHLINTGWQQEKKKNKKNVQGLLHIVKGAFAYTKNRFPLSVYSVLSLLITENSAFLNMCC